MSFIVWLRQSDHPDERMDIVRALADGPMSESEIQEVTGISLRQIRKLAKRMESEGILSWRLQRWLLP